MSRHVCDCIYQWNLEFDVYNWVYLKISSIKGVKRFGGKLSPYYVNLYYVLSRIAKVAYNLELSSVL